LATTDTRTDAVLGSLAQQIAQAGVAIAQQYGEIIVLREQLADAQGEIANLTARLKAAETQAKPEPPTV